MKKEIPLAITFIVALIVIVGYFFNIPAIANASKELQSWGVIVSAFALGLAAVNLTRIHVMKIAQKRTGWPFSILLLFCMYGVIAIGLTQGVNSRAYSLFLVTPRTALGATIYSLLGFYIASASYRAFVARNADATILLLSAAVILFGQTPYGEAMSGIVKWLNDIPNMAAQRAIIIGAAVGGIALSLRIMVGLERSYLGVGGE